MIREIQISELDSLEETAREFCEIAPVIGMFSPAKFRALWTTLISSGSGVIFADEWSEDGETAIAGMIGGVIHPEIYGEEKVAAEFFWFVRETHRGAGVRLYRRFEDWAREQGAARIQMVHLFESMPDKVARFYLRAGFAPVEIRYQKTLTRGQLCQ